MVDSYDTSKERANKVWYELSHRCHHVAFSIHNNHNHIDTATLRMILHLMIQYHDNLLPNKPRLVAPTCMLK
jgi:hypothetical protein